MSGRSIGAIVSALIGGVIAAVTLVGIITHSLDSTSSDPGDVNASVPYGSTQ
jgi:hypothetical protein